MCVPDEFVYLMGDELPPLSSIPDSGGRCGKAIWASGDFQKGDYEKFYDFVAKNRSVIGAVGRLYPAKVIFFRSNGGDLAEAIKIGRLIRNLHLSTEIGSSPVVDIGGILFDMYISNNPSDAICASACVFAWAGGVERRGNFALVVHRPYFNPEYYSQLNAEDAQEQYRALETEAYGYLEEMEVPLPFIDRMRRIGSGDGELIEQEYIQRRLATVPSLDEWYASKCQPKSNWVNVDSCGVRRKEITKRIKAEFGDW